MGHVIFAYKANEHVTENRIINSYTLSNSSHFLTFSMESSKTNFYNFFEILPIEALVNIYNDFI